MRLLKNKLLQLWQNGPYFSSVLAATLWGVKRIVLLDVVFVLQDRNTRDGAAKHLVTSTTIYLSEWTGVLLSAVMDSGSRFNLILQL